MRRISRDAEQELFGYNHRPTDTSRMEKLGYILRNGHTPDQKRRAYAELSRRIEVIQSKGHIVGHYTDMLR